MKAPVSSAISGRSASPSADTMASSLVSPAQPRASAMSSLRSASVSTGMKWSARPSATVRAPAACSTSTRMSRDTVECW